jgi:hypothetical protein
MFNIKNYLFTTIFLIININNVFSYSYSEKQLEDILSEVKTELSRQVKSISENLKWSRRQFKKVLKQVTVFPDDSKCSENVIMFVRNDGRNEIFYCTSILNKLVSELKFIGIKKQLITNLIKNIYIHEILHLMEFQHGIEMFTLHDEVIQYLPHIENAFSLESHSEFSSFYKEQIRTRKEYYLIHHPQAQEFIESYFNQMFKL